MSGYLHTRLAVGDLIDVAAPRGTFILDQSDAPVLLISAGIGATPVMAMLYALARAHSEREVWWLQSARNSRECPFAGESQTLLAELPNARTRVYYSRPAADIEGRDFDVAGRLTPSVVAELELPRSAEAYICGPTGFMQDISAGLASMGLDASRIHTELFGPEPGITPGIAEKSARTPHAPAGPPEKDRRSSSPAATSPSRGAATMPACWSWPRPVTSRSAGLVGRGSATPARPPSSPVTSTTHPNRSSHRPKEAP